MEHAHLLVFDIETVYDHAAAARLTGHDPADVPGCRLALEAYHRARGPGNFPAPPFHQVLVISLLWANIVREGRRERYELKKLGSLNAVSGEPDLIARFFGCLDKTPRLVTFNGRRFDLPVLKFRAMVHHLAADALFSPGSSRWENYAHRYCVDWHCDLLDALTDFRLSPAVDLNQACAALGLPGKGAIDGAKVSDLHDAGRHQAIADYCETDVLNTYLLYLRYGLLRGTLDRASHAQALADLDFFLEREGAARPHLQDFRDEWRAGTSVGLAAAQA